MKKIFLLLIIVSSISFSAYTGWGNSTEIPKFSDPSKWSDLAAMNKVTDSIHFGMKYEEFKKALPQKEYYRNNEGTKDTVFYYKDVKDPLGRKTEASFYFMENRLMSSIFTYNTTVKEHKKLDAEYRKLYSKRKGYTKLQNAYASATLLYTSYSLLYVKFIPDDNNSNTGKTMVYIQITSPVNLSKYLREIDMLNRIGD